ncbi:hypothetical protein V7S43_014784 [Phytophthora oleae]|uniref:Uncharacterized protein n=1 Tax=Phytophthora oleae TaxID=2107226 RepID=A0ABD3F1U5_9STRA
MWSRQCLAFNLGEKYCTDTMQLNDTETKLWNYDNDHAINQMRSASQLACILTLVGYSLSFLSHETEALQEESVSTIKTHSMIKFVMLCCLLGICRPITDRYLLTFWLSETGDQADMSTDNGCSRLPSVWSMPKVVRDLLWTVTSPHLLSGGRFPVLPAEFGVEALKSPVVINWLKVLVEDPAPLLTFLQGK